MVYYTVSTYVEKTGPGNFLLYVNLMAMGQQKRLITYKRTDSTYNAIAIYYMYSCSTI
jgi:hypothetical protein